MPEAPFRFFNLTVLIGADAHGQADNDGRHAVAQRVVEPHGAVVDVPHLSQHTVHVYRLEQQPREGREPQVVQQDGHHLTGKLGEYE